LGVTFKSGFIDIKKGNYLSADKPGFLAQRRVRTAPAGNCLRIS